MSRRHNMAFLTLVASLILTASAVGQNGCSIIQYVRGHWRFCSNASFPTVHHFDFELSIAPFACTNQTVTISVTLRNVATSFTQAIFVQTGGTGGGLDSPLVVSIPIGISTADFPPSDPWAIDEFVSGAVSGGGCNAPIAQCTYSWVYNTSPYSPDPLYPTGPPDLYSQPDPIVVLCGEMAVLPAPPMTWGTESYQWRRYTGPGAFDFVPIASSTSTPTSYSIPNVTPADGGIYGAFLTNCLGDSIWVVNLCACPSGITGRVAMATGLGAPTPVAGALVGAYAVTSNGSPSPTSSGSDYSDSDGKYLIKALPPGPYVVRARLAHQVTSVANYGSAVTGTAVASHDTDPNTPGPTVVTVVQNQVTSGVDLKFGQPVIMVHGVLSNGTIWVNPGHLAMYLQQHGYPTYVVNTTPIPYHGVNGLILRSFIQNHVDVDLGYHLAELPKKNLIVHSMGGLTARVYVCDSGIYRNDIDTVMMLGTPHHGSPWVERIVRTGLSSGFAGQLATGLFAAFGGLGLSEAYLAPFGPFNLTYRRSSGVRWEFVAGESSGAPALALQLTLFGGEQNDMFVGSSSARGSALPGSRWITDNIHTGLHDILSGAPYNDYRRLLEHEAPITLTPSSATDTPRTSTEPPLVPVGAGLLTPSVPVVNHAFMLDSPTTTSVILLSASSGTHITLTTPLGQLLTPSSPGVTHQIQDLDAGALETWTISTPQAGTWTAQVSASGAIPAAGIEYSTVATSESAIALTVPGGLPSYASGATVNLTAILSDGGVGLPGATTVATIMRPDTTIAGLTLFDDGQHGDGAVGDGTYANQFLGTSLPGTYQFSIRAAIAGQHLSRVTVGAFQVSPNSAQLGGPIAEAAVDTDHNGVFDVLRLTVPVIVGATGTFVLSGELRAAGGAHVSYAATSRNGLLPSASPHAFTLEFPASDIVAAGMAGNFVLADLRLFDGTQDLVPIQSVSVAHTTSPYQLRDFSTPEVVGSFTAPLGAVTSWTLKSPQDPNRPYLAAVAFANSPGFPLALLDPLGTDSRVVPLTPDDLLFLSISQSLPNFVGFSGVLSPTGEATASLVVPGEPTLRGTTIWMSFTTFDPGYPLGVRAMAAAHEIRFE